MALGGSTALGRGTVVLVGVVGGDITFEVSEAIGLAFDVVVLGVTFWTAGSWIGDDTFGKVSSGVVPNTSSSNDTEGISASLISSLSLS